MDSVKIHLTKHKDREKYMMLTAKGDFFANNLKITLGVDKITLDAVGESSIYDTKKPLAKKSNWYQLGVPIEWDNGDYFSDEDESTPDTLVFYRDSGPQ